MLLPLNFGLAKQMARLGNDRLAGQKGSFRALEALPGPIVKLAIPLQESDKRTGIEQVLDQRGQLRQLTLTPVIQIVSVAGQVGRTAVNATDQSS